jgi:hypothetical protein
LCTSLKVHSVGGLPGAGPPVPVLLSVYFSFTKAVRAARSIVDTQFRVSFFASASAFLFLCSKFELCRLQIWGGVSGSVFDHGGVM